MTLAEALSQVQLEAGRTYGCEVNGNQVFVRVVAGSGIQPAARFDESDVMLDPWCDLPMQGKPIPNVKVTWGTLPIDIPEIPADSE